jgi:hypothetical protein
MDDDTDCEEHTTGLRVVEFFFVTVAGDRDQ